MPKKKRKISQHQQSDQFIEKARELEADESGNIFEKAFEAIARTARKTKSRNKDRDED